MKTVNVNDKEYDYDSLTEEQVTLLTEISACSAEVKRSNYASALFDSRYKMLMTVLVDSLESNDDQTEMDV
tara:strand:- start:1867 stop:2079 length:213 start_codon:yes stop_codon:yes gene_type:complete